MQVVPIERPAGAGQSTYIHPPDMIRGDLAYTR